MQEKAVVDIEFVRGKHTQRGKDDPGCADQCPCLGFSLSYSLASPS